VNAVRREREGGPEIRPVEVSDLDDLMEIERVCFPSPWSRQVFLDELSREWARLLVLCPTPGGSPVAFINYWIVRDEIHILNVATHPAHRRRGFASRLLGRTLGQAPTLGVRYITLEVRRSNKGAFELYRGFGFESIGVRPRYYVENQEDAIVMLLSLGGSGS